MTDHFDALEIRDPEVRERELFAALPDQLSHAKSCAAYFARLLESIDVRKITSREALASLPVTRKSNLRELQQANPPFGALVATPAGRLARIFVSPGPIYDPEGRDPDYWRTARALHAAGFRAGDVVQNCFSYHLTPAGSMFETGLVKLGCAVVPGGVGQTDQQAVTMAELRVNGYVGTPSFLKLILEKADESGRDLGSLTRALVSAEAFLPAQRTAFESRGIHACQAYGTADLGIIAYETQAHEGLVVDEGVIVEIVRPGTGNPVSDGEIGEVVVTTFCRDYPLVRFALGDLSSVLPGVSPCGRTNMRVKGWLGRADQTTKVRGLFVHPHQVAAVVERVPVIRRARLIVESVEGNDRMRLLCEVDADATDELRARIAALARNITKLRCEIEIVGPESLPKDGKVIDDLRKLT